MADIPTASHTHRRARPAFIRLDMTPLVDLAFLLLSFFILTTTLRKLEAIDLATRAGAGGGGVAPSITWLVNARGEVHGYAGAFDPDTTPVRRYGLDQVRAAARAVTDTAHFTCIIKAAPQARYQAVVAVLDQVAFLGPAHYTIQEGLDPAEEARSMDTKRP